MEVLIQVTTDAQGVSVAPGIVSLASLQARSTSDLGMADPSPYLDALVVNGQLTAEQRQRAIVTLVGQSSMVYPLVPSTLVVALNIDPGDWLTTSGVVVVVFNQAPYLPVFGRITEADQEGFTLKGDNPDWPLKRVQLRDIAYLLQAFTICSAKIV